MGAQSSVSNHLSSIACRQDSRGEQVIPYSSVKELEAEGRARIAELTAQLAETNRCRLQKEQDVEQTKRLMTKLQGMVDLQSKEQDRISHMEAIQNEQLSCSEAKVNKLLLAIAGEKHRAEVAEQAIEDLPKQIAMEWQTTVQQLTDRLGKEESLRRTAEEAAKTAEEAAKKNEAQLADAQQSSAMAPQTSESSLMFEELQQQFSEEVKNRMEVQSNLLEKDRVLRECQGELSRRPSIEGMSESEVNLILQAQARLADAEANRREAEEKLMDQELQLQHLQKQVDDEIKSRMQVQQLLAEKEQRAADVQTAMEGDELLRKQTLQTQVVEKTREVCALQQQVQDELLKRQATQYQILEKERMACHLQNQLMGISQMSDMDEAMIQSGPQFLNSGPAFLELNTHHEEAEDKEGDPEKDEEDQPPSDCSTSGRLGDPDEGSPATMSPGVSPPVSWTGSVQTSRGKSITVPQTQQLVQQYITSADPMQGVQAPMTPWASMSFQPVYLGCSPTSVYRTVPAGNPDGPQRSARSRAYIVKTSTTYSIPSAPSALERRLMQAARTFT